jgi:hypothetical protein
MLCSVSVLAADHYFEQLVLLIVWNYTMFSFFLLFFISCICSVLCLNVVHPVFQSWEAACQHSVVHGES